VTSTDWCGLKKIRKKEAANNEELPRVFYTC
jgi:hypothetical protein